MFYYLRTFLLGFTSLAMAEAQAEGCPSADYLQAHMNHLIEDSLLKFEDRLYTYDPRPESDIDLIHQIKNTQQMMDFNKESARARDQNRNVQYIKAPTYDGKKFHGTVDQLNMHSSTDCRYALSYKIGTAIGTRSESSIVYYGYLNLKEAPDGEMTTTTSEEFPPFQPEVHDQRRGEWKFNIPEYMAKPSNPSE